MCLFSIVNSHSFILFIETPRCKDKCKRNTDGYYASCKGCDWYITCTNGKKQTNKCKSGTMWNDIRKSCIATPGCAGKCLTFSLPYMTEISVVIRQ